MKKVCIVIPSGSMVHANFAICLAALSRSTKNVDLNFLNIKSSNITISRSRAVEELLKLGTDYLLFIDSDISFPYDALQRLFDHAEETGHRVVGCNYLQKTPPFRSLTYGLDDTQTSQEVSGFVPVRRLPTGFLLIHMSVFNEMTAPHFRFLYKDKTDTELGVIVGEDYYFCDKCYELGIDMYLDVELSMNLTHWGDRGVQWASNEVGYQFVTDFGLE